MIRIFAHEFNSQEKFDKVIKMNVSHTYKRIYYDDKSALQLGIVHRNTISKTITTNETKLSGFKSINRSFTKNNDNNIAKSS